MRRVGSDATTPQTASEVTASVAAEPMASENGNKVIVKKVMAKRVRVMKEKGDLFFIIVRKDGF